MISCRRASLVCLLTALTWSHLARSQELDISPTTRPADELIALNFPENCELKLLIQYVSDRLGINILYEDQTVAQRVTIKSPARIPKNSLLGLLDSTLRMKGLMLVDGDQPNWKRVVPATNLQSIARPSTQPSGKTGPNQPTQVVAQIFHLLYADPQRADPVIRPFLTTPGGSVVALPDQHLLIVTDYAPVVDKVAALLNIIDQPGKPAEVQFIAAKFVDAQSLAQQLEQYLVATQKQQVSQPQLDAVSISTESRTNRIVLIGPAGKLAAAAALLQQIDVAQDVATRYYALKSASPERIDRLARELVKPVDLAKTYNSVIDKDANLLIVIGSDLIQKQVASLIQNLDQPQAAAEESPVRFYKLQNATATEVLATIGGIEGDGTTPVAIETSAAPAEAQNLPPPQVPGGNRPPAGPGQPALPPPIYHDSTKQGSENSAPVVSQKIVQSQSIHTKGATVTSDPNTNTIIVVARPQVQKVYEQLIRTLDKRRPQVLVEATVVTLDTTDNFSFGVELSGKASAGETKFLSFSSFGLSDTTNTTSTGQLAIIPGAGFNGVVLNSSIGTAVVRALAGSGRAKVFSSPRILVNDNATGNLSSIAEAPFTSVNASQTVSTTSFAGYASAGTTVTITPHISEGEHLQLEYSVSLNSFTGSGTGGIPPPRQTDAISSQVTIPDGSVIVVGGLNRSNTSETVQRVPILGQIPLLKYLFSSRTTNDENTTLFVFLRPVILRDDQFADLKYLSGKEVKLAGIEGDIPNAIPMLMK